MAILAGSAEWVGILVSIILLAGSSRSGLLVREEARARIKESYTRF